MNPLVTPPALRHPKWRQLWLGGAFAQLSLVTAGSFSKQAADRGLRLGIGHGPLERLDRLGVLRPIAFAELGTQYVLRDTTTPAVQGLTFREEQPSAEWSTFATVAHGHAHVTALYSPWQLLYLDAAMKGDSVEVDLAALLAPSDQLQVTLERRRTLLESLQARWLSLDDSWQPLTKLLVRLQNRYLPEVTNRTTLLYDADQQGWVSPWPAERQNFDAQAVAEEAGVTAEQVTDAYHFLVERGIDREPRDGLETLRRARPRSSRKFWRGPALQAQDHFDAAHLLCLYLTDLTGDPPERTPRWPLDGRQRERADLYDRGPAARITRDLLQKELVHAGIYPHGVHLVGEGVSEDKMVRHLASALLGYSVVDDLGFTDLAGVGAADRLPTMVGGFTTYAQRTVVIVDAEGKMAEYVKGLVTNGVLPDDDAHVSEPNLEEENFSRAELREVLVGLAADPPADLDLPAVTLDVPLDAAETEHEQRQSNSTEVLGFVGTLLKLAQDPKYGGPVTIRKPELALALAQMLVEEFQGHQDDMDAVAALREKRPLLDFVFNRVIPILAAPSWR